MNATCSDRDRIFEDGTPAEWAALEAHAATCAICAEELRAWKLGWQTALAGAFAVILALSTGWIYLHRSPNGGSVGDPSFLKSKALKEVESAETAYERAIDKLAAEAKPQLDNPATPLLANYHEKLQVLDSAIGDLRAQAGLNPSNAQLRYQLLAMYQEEQHTLEEVLEARQR